MDKAAVSHAGDPGTIPGFPSLILWSSIELIFSHPKVLWLFLWPSQKTWTLLKWNNVWKRRSWKSWVHKPKLNNSKPNAEYTNKVLLIPLMAKPINLFFFAFIVVFFFWLIFFLLFFSVVFFFLAAVHIRWDREIYIEEILELMWWSSFGFSSCGNLTSFLSFLVFFFRAQHS